jgi:acetyl-CoA C-acetyltransferase
MSSLVSKTLSTIPKPLLSSAIFACSVQSNQGVSPAKQILSLNGFESVPCILINKGHSGGLFSLILACQSLMLHEDLVLCGAFDSSSTSPHTIQGRQGWSSGSQLKDELPTAYLNDEGTHLGLALEAVVSKIGIARVEQEDYFRHVRIRRKVMQKLKYFEKEIVQLDLLAEDELVEYPENKPFGPLFYSTGTITAVTSALPADGAGAFLLAKKKVAQKFGLNHLASVLAFWKGRSEDFMFWETAVEGVKKVLFTHGLNVDNVGLWEINDFFAVFPVVLCKMLKIDYGIVNVAGGNLSIGDTLAASSARCVVSACSLLKERDVEFAVVVSINCAYEISVVLLRAESITH